MTRNASSEVAIRYERAIDPGSRLLWLQNPVFAAAGEEAVAALAAQAMVEEFAPDETIMTAGEPPAYVRVLLHGTARIFHRAPDGREVTVKLLRAPNIFADIECLNGIGMLESVAAVDPAVVARLETPAYIAFLRAHPDCMFEHMRHIAAAFCVAARSERQVFAPLDQRIANLLLSYADLYGVRNGGEIWIRYPLSLPKIAQSLAVVTRSVAYVCSRWSKAKILGREGNFFVLRQPALLEELAAPIRHSIAYSIGQSLTKLHVPDRDDVAELELGPAGQLHPVGAELIIGSHPESGLRLPDAQVSSAHCRIFRGSTGQRFWVADLGSDRGTWLNGRRIRRAVLRDGDRLEVGRIGLTFRLREQAL